MAMVAAVYSQRGASLLPAHTQEHCISQEWQALALSVRTTGSASIPWQLEEERGNTPTEPSPFRQSQSQSQGQSRGGKGQRFYSVPDTVLLWTHSQVFMAVKRAAEAYLARYHSAPTRMIVPPGVYARFVQATGQVQCASTSPRLYLHGPSGRYAVVLVQTYPPHERIGFLLERSFVFLYDNEKEGKTN